MIQLWEKGSNPQIKVAIFTIFKYFDAVKSATFQIKHTTSNIYIYIYMHFNVELVELLLLILFA